MSKNLNISVLVAARDEYIEQLKCIITPLMIQGFNSIYQDSIRISNGKQVIYKFQELLKEIPKWNQTILQEESKRIKKKCPYIMDIVTAIFVSNVKILASIRLKGKNENIRVKIPTSDIFIHSIYIESAQQFFYNPFLFYHRTNEFGNIQKNKYHVKEIIRDSVDETVRQMLPFDNILQEYLANALDENIENVSDSDQSNESFSDEESIHGERIINEPGSEEEAEELDQPEPEIKKFNFNVKQNTFPPSLPPQPQITPQSNFQQPSKQIPFLDDDLESDDSDENGTNLEEPTNPEERRQELYQTQLNNSEERRREEPHREERRHEEPHREERRHEEPRHEEPRHEEPRKDKYSFF